MWAAFLPKRSFEPRAPAPGLAESGPLTNEPLFSLAVNDIPVGAGRAANVAGLNPEAAGIQYRRSGVAANDFLQTTNPRVYAAGEMLSEITLAMAAGVGLKTISQTIPPYPTQAEAIKKVADAYNRTRLTPFWKGLSRRWLEWARR